MSRLDEIKDLYDRYILKTYGSYQLAFTRGEGAYLYDTEGVPYLDFVAGLAVNNLGHSHPAVVEAIKNQAEQLLHTSNLFLIDRQAELAEVLVENSFPGKCFFCNSGAEANEAALKLARKYSVLKYGPGRHQVITARRSFHGRTMATISATGQEKFHKHFHPFLEGFKYIDFNDAEALENAIEDSTCAVMLEPLQGEGGVHPPQPEYLKKVREICDRYDILLILDEIQTGFGRTGKLFAHQNYGITPDIMSLAKALGGGVAIGAIVASEKVQGAFSPGDHASTFGGNYLACAAALAATKEMTKDGFCDNVALLGSYLEERLEGLKDRYAFIKELRGIGLMWGLELDIPAGDIVKDCMENKLLINCVADTVLRFLPPLIIRKTQIDRMVDVLSGVMDDHRS